MKIRTDFVTNSSTTCFLLITDAELDKAKLFDLLGVMETSPLAVVIQRLYDILTEELEAGELRHEGPPLQCWACEKLITKHKLPSELATRAHNASFEGKRTYSGHFSSDSDQLESFLCTDSFEIEGEGLYLNALEDRW